MKFTTLVSAVSALVAGTSALEKGFNYGALNADGSCGTYWDFHDRFSRSKQLWRAPGFNTARLYTSIQCGSANAPIEAIKAALDTKTNLLLGIWASAGQDVVTNEIIAMKDAAQRWPNQMRTRVKAISVGSEDLYRSSDQGIANNAGVGATADQIVSYIEQVREALKGTALEGKPVGHVDTWTAWVLPENGKVIDSVNWLGHNSFPYVCVGFPCFTVSAADRSLVRDHQAQLDRPCQGQLRVRTGPNRRRRQGQARLGHRDWLAVARPPVGSSRRQHRQRQAILERGRLRQPVRQAQRVLVYAL